jgi:predicted phage-related endonuclease
VNKYKIYTGGVRDSDDLLIGASDVPILMREIGSPIKKTPYQLWREKTGKDDNPFKGNFATWQGHMMEPIIVAQHIIRDEQHEWAEGKTTALACADRYYQDFVRRSVRRSARSRAPTPYIPYTEARHPKYPWAMAHADVLVREYPERPYLIEAKHGSTWSRLRSVKNPGGFDPNIEGPDGVPYAVQIQAQWQMFCYGVDLNCVAMITNAEYYEWWIEADKKVQAILLERAARFYEACISDVAPDPQSYEDIKYMYPDVHDKALVLTAGQSLDTARELYNRKKKLKEKIKPMEKELKDIKNAVGIMLKDNKAVVDGMTNEKLFSQSINKNGVRTQR